MFLRRICTLGCIFCLFAGCAAGRLETILQQKDLNGFRAFVDEEGPTWVDGQGRTLLYRAAGKGSLEMVKYLVEKGADVNQQNVETGNAPLHNAAWWGNLEIIRFLIDKGANVDAVNKAGSTPVFFAMDIGKLDAAKLLHEMGASLKHVAKKNGYTLLHQASDKGQPKIIMWLVEKGLDPQALDNEGRTPAQVATRTAFGVRGDPRYKQKVYAALKGEYKEEEKGQKPVAAGKMGVGKASPVPEAPVAKEPVTSAQNQRIIAVFNISTKGIELGDVFLDGLGDFLAMKLAETGKFRVVPRSELKKRLVETKTESHKQCYDQNCQIEMGRELAAEVTLATQISKLGSNCVVSSAIYDLKQATTSQAFTATGACKEDDLFSLVDQVVNKLGK